MGIIAEEKGLFSLKAALKESNEKIVRRKLWVFGSGVMAGKEAALKRWREIKRGEKSEKLFWE